RHTGIPTLQGAVGRRHHTGVGRAPYFFRINASAELTPEFQLLTVEFADGAVEPIPRTRRREYCRTEFFHGRADGYHDADRGTGTQPVLPGSARVDLRHLPHADRAPVRHRGEQPVQ